MQIVSINIVVIVFDKPVATTREREEGREILSECVSVCVRLRVCLCKCVFMSMFVPKGTRF